MQFFVFFFQHDKPLAEALLAKCLGFLDYMDDSAKGPQAKGYGPAAARSRVVGALRELGPGLSDVALRCCCYLEGLESAEKRMGWSARSGKIVLRIALQRLKRHYDETLTPESQMIG